MIASEDWDTQTNATEDYGNEDLERAANLIKHLQDENETLKDNFESLKGLHLTLQEKFCGLTAELQDSQQEKEANEVEIESVRATMRLQAEELARARFRINNNSEVEAAKASVRSEVEAACALKCTVMEKDNERLHNNYFSLKAEYESLKSETEARALHNQQALKECGAEFESKMGALVEEVKKLKGHQGRAIDLQKQVKELDVEKQYLQKKFSELEKALKVSRKERADAVSERDSVEIAAERKLHHAKATEVELQGIVDALQSRVASLQQEVQSNHEDRLKSHSTVLELQTAHAEMIEKIEQENIDHRVEVQGLKDELQDVQQMSEKERKDLEWQMSRREEQLSRMEADHGVEIVRLQEQHDKAVKELEAQHVRKAEELSKTVMDLQAEVGTLRREIDDMQKAHDAKVQGFNERMDSVRGEMEEAHKREFLAETQSTKLQKEIDNLKLQSETKQELINRLERCKDDLVNTANAHLKSISELEERNRDLSKQTMELRIKHDADVESLEVMNANHKHQLQQVKLEWENEREEMKNSAANEVRKLQQVHRQEVSLHDHKVAKAKHVIKEMRRERERMVVQVSELQAKVLQAEIGRASRLSDSSLELMPRLDIAGGSETGKVDFSNLLEDMSALQRRQQLYLEHSRLS